jgi:hypothetical protein
MVSAIVAGSSSAQATGHGPVYALSTPTLPQGAWSLDIGAMYWRSAHQAAMVRPMLGYGITPDLELTLSVPVPVYHEVPEHFPRMMGMMPGTPDVEALLAWRFARSAPEVGSRFESTVLLGLDYPTDERRAGVQTAPGVVMGAVVGYASRSVYAWLGGLYRRYLTASGIGSDHPGDLLMVTAAVGYRPPMFRQELPHADWRVFIEAVGERTGQNRIGGGPVDLTGGTSLYAGPSVLGLFGAWGISGGPLFRLYTNMNAAHADDIRVVVNFSYWF